MPARDRGSDLLARRRAPDRALALVLIGTALLLPPIASVFLIDGKIAGAPIPFVYILFVWGSLIAAAAVLARSLREDDTPSTPASLSETGGLSSENN